MPWLKQRLDHGLERYQRRRSRVHKQVAARIGNERLERFLFDRRRSDLGAEPFGYDPFGFEPETALRAVMAILPIYQRWFRVESTGVENIPTEGAALIVPNHSGVLPLDGVMIGMDTFLKMERPRIVRTIIERFFANVPYVSTFMQRVGQVIGTRRNFQWLLEHGELVGVFPEGAKGTGKLFKNRYKLIHFNVGFIELALQHRVPIVPTAVIGGEEQFPMLMDIKPIAKAIGFPYFPITATFPMLGPLGLIPFPTKYKIRYGQPLHLYKDYDPDAVRNPKIVKKLAAEVQSIVQEMVTQGARERKSIWRG